MIKEFNNKELKAFLGSFMKRLLQKSLLVASCFLPFSSSYGANPNEKIFNPHPSKDDVVINLPCDQIMVFKKIYTQIGKNKKIYDKAFFSGTNLGLDLLV